MSEFKIPPEEKLYSIDEIADMLTSFWNAEEGQFGEGEHDDVDFSDNCCDSAE